MGWSFSFKQHGHISLGVWAMAAVRSITCTLSLISFTAVSPCSFVHVFAQPPVSLKHTHTHTHTHTNATKLVKTTHTHTHKRTHTHSHPHPLSPHPSPYHPLLSHLPIYSLPHPHPHSHKHTHTHTYTHT